MLVSKQSFYEILRLAHSPAFFAFVPDNKKAIENHDSMFEKARKEWIKQGFCEPDGDKLKSSFEFQRMLYDLGHAKAVLEWWENGRKQSYVRLPIRILEVSTVRNQLELRHTVFQELFKRAKNLVTEKKTAKMAVTIFDDEMKPDVYEKQLDFSENVEEMASEMAKLLHMFCRGEKFDESAISK